MHILDKFLHSICKKENITYSKTSNSTYYNIIGTKRIRVSDHTTTSSKSLFSIIKTNIKSQYILHNHNTNCLKIISFKECKSVVDSFIFLFDIKVLKGDNLEPNPSEQKIKELTSELEYYKVIRKHGLPANNIFGISKSKFTNKQILSLNNTIKSYIKK